MGSSSIAPSWTNLEKGREYQKQQPKINTRLRFQLPDNLPHHASVTWKQKT